MYQSALGTWHFLGVWRRVGPRGSTAREHQHDDVRSADRGQLVGHGKKPAGEGDAGGADGGGARHSAGDVLRGATTLSFGDSDCNPCATDVPRSSSSRSRTGTIAHGLLAANSWKYRATGPTTRRRKTRGGLSTHRRGRSHSRSNHIQSLVRTNSSRFRSPAAIATAAPARSSSSRSSAADTGSLDVRIGAGIQAAWPSLVMGCSWRRARQLRRFSVKRAGEPQRYPRFDIPRTEPRGAEKDETRGLDCGGGGIGLARLYDGSTLLVVSAPGGGFRFDVAGVAGNNARRTTPGRGDTRFYRFVPNGLYPTPDFAARRMAARANRRHAVQAGAVFRKSVAGDRVRVRTPVHDSHDRTSRLEGRRLLDAVEGGGPPDRPRLVRLGRATQKQDNESCHHRSSATVRVNANAQLEFLCSERLTTKRNPTGEFDFREGRR